MSERFTSPAPEQMSEQQRAIYDLFASGRRAQPSNPFALVNTAGRLQGPPAVWVLSPPLGAALERLGAAIRYELTLAPRTSEIAILMVAHRYRSEFEWYAHSRAGAAAGLSTAELEVLERGGTPDPATDEERVAVWVTRQILDHATLDDQQYGDAVAVLGTRRLFELVTLVGYYALLAAQLNAFGLRPPAGD